MKKITLLIAILISFVNYSQTNKQLIQNYLDTNKSKFELTSQDISDLSLFKEVEGSGTKITSCYILQQYNGIEIFNAQSLAAIKNSEVIDFSNNFISNIASKVNTITPTLTVLQAIATVYNKLGINEVANFKIVENEKTNYFKINDATQEDNISAKLVYQVVGNNLKLAWAFQFYTPDGKHLWDLRLDALNGNILEKNDLMLTCNFGDSKHKNKQIENIFSFENAVFNKQAASMLVAPSTCTYRVVPYNYESPNHTPTQLVSTIGDAVASPNGWHDINTTIGGTSTTLKFNYTRGNNVFAQEDANGDNGTGARTNASSGTAGNSLTFDFPYTSGGVSQALQPTDYTSASTTNLFYMNNIMHDVWYKYGFTETAANFQRNNFSRGGVTNAVGDPVSADSQDGWNQTTATLNNANFSTPADGSAPRMQMFMWNSGAPPTNFITVNSPSSIAGPRAATTNVFDTTDRIPVPAAPNGITQNLVHYVNTPNNGTTANSNIVTIHNACIPATNSSALAGKIALIRRGGCAFSIKVKNAQDAGALAVIVMDTIAMNPQRLSMSSTGLLGITIPAVFVTKEIGDQFIANMATEPVNVKLEVPSGLYLFADGSFDNMIISHEYGHGISNRLIGGGSGTCMTNGEQMGEGWSDWFGLMMQIKTGDVGTTPKGVGTYAINEPTTGAGIRTFPYSTDMAINPWTLSGSNDTQVHNRGEVWTAVMWDLTWKYIEKYGFDPDIYAGTGGNNKVMRLALDALKLQACNTASFISSRDKLIAADQATTGGADYCLITEVFTRRGMGLNASSGLNTDPLDQVENFTPFPAGPNCSLAIDYFENNDMLKVYPNPTNGLFNLQIAKFSGKLNIQVTDLNGRLVYDAKNTDFNIEKAIDLSAYQSGVYILKVSGEKLNYSQKLIKN